MPKTNNLIELNGKFYDMVTGAQVPAEGVTPQHVMKMQKVEVVKRPHLGHSTRHSIDGFTRHVPHNSKPLAHHQPTRSTTLMRHAVKKPVVAPPATPVAKAVAPMDITTHKKLQHLPQVTPKLSHNQVHPARAQRAASAPHSDAIRRFSDSGHLQPASAATPANHERPVMNSHAKPAHHPGQLHRQHQQEQAAKNDSTDIFAHALAAATQHDHTEHRLPLKAKKQGARKGKLLAVAGVTAAFLLVVGMVFYSNKAAFEIQFASMRSGISASLPGYKPQGYAVKGMQYAPGNVTIGFQGPSNQQFTVAQKESNWDSDTLMDNFVATSDQSYQAYQANGRTVFIYGKGNATWVNGGIWYQLKSDSLSDDEMLKVASTM